MTLAAVSGAERAMKSRMPRRFWYACSVRMTRYRLGGTGMTFLPRQRHAKSRSRILDRHRLSPFGLFEGFIQFGNSRVVKIIVRRSGVDEVLQCTGHEVARRLEPP